MNPELQNLLHIPMFAGFVVLLFSLGYKDSGVAASNRFWPVLLAMVYGVVLELIQMKVPGRYASFMDVLLDMVGIGSGLLFWQIAARPKKNRGI